MERERGVVCLGVAEIIADSGSFGALELTEQRINHHVADEADALIGDAFGAKVGVRILGRREQKVCELVCQEAIDFFGHRAVTAAESGFDVRDSDAELRAHERARERRVNVSNDERPIGFFFQHDRLEALHHGCRLRGVRARADAEIHVRLRQAEIVEEGVGHLRVVVLPRMNDERRKLSLAPLHGFDNRRDLHKVGARADDVNDFEH